MVVLGVVLKVVLWCINKLIHEGGIGGGGIRGGIGLVFGGIG